MKIISYIVLGMCEVREIDGFPGYSISEEGDVMNVLTGAIVATHVDSKNYKRVNLWRDGKNHTLRVHQLIGKAFIPNPDNLPCVDHIINGRANRQDNRIENLRWASLALNAQNREVCESNKLGEKHICLGSRGYYEVSITVDGKSVLHTAFKTLEKAIKARDDFLRDGTKPKGMLGATGERWISIDEGRYALRIKNKRYGSYATLEEAIKKRDSLVDE